MSVADLEVTRESLRAVACYVVGPARKARTGRIGLRPTGDGFGTPPFDDGSRILVRGDRLVVEPGGEIVLTTLRDAAEFVGVALSADPGVGPDVPPFEPDAPLLVDAEASLAIGRWYAFGAQALDHVRAEIEGRATVTEAQLWPEHFDLAVTATLARGPAVNIGFSPGDGFVPEPYAYVGPHALERLTGEYWNASFGAVMHQSELGDDAASAVNDFILRGVDQL